jgi:hypothetical protein
MMDLLRRLVRLLRGEPKSRCENCAAEGPVSLGRVYEFDGYVFHPIQAMVCEKCNEKLRSRRR